MGTNMSHKKEKSTFLLFWGNFLFFYLLEIVFEHQVSQTTPVGIWKNGSTGVADLR